MKLNYYEAQITEAVCRHLNVEFEKIDIPTRGRGHIAYARQMCMHMLSAHAVITQERIAEIFGRERSAVSHATSVIMSLRNKKWIVQQDIAAIEKMIAQPVLKTA